jgi:multimeric flavodoxin WrbA
MKINTIVLIQIKITFDICNSFRYTIQVKNVLIINGSLGGRAGNTSMLLKKIRRMILKTNDATRVRIVHLHPTFSWNTVKGCIKRADCLIFSSGTYWDSWGSPMQLLFEKMTVLEGSKYLVGKPACAVVTMHSVGGKEVVSRILGNLVSLGCMIPPFAGFAYSYADHVAHKTRTSGRKLLDDVWHIQDLQTLLNNLLKATSIEVKPEYEVWNFLDTAAFDPTTVWLK